MLLRLNPQGILNYADAPFFFQVRPFSHDLVLEVIGKAIVFKDHVNAYYMTFQLLFVTVSHLVPMNPVFLTESLNIVVVILRYFSDNGG
jgi:hypothetical protein